MGTTDRISRAFNLLCVIILVVIVGYAIFSFTQLLFIDVFNENKIVKDENVINELQESINKYYDYLYFGQFEKAKHCTSLLSRLTDNQYNKIHELLVNEGEYFVVVKYAYKLYGNTYRCYVVTYDKTEKKYDYSVKNNKKEMTKIVVSLDRVNNNFTIIQHEHFGI